MQKLTKTAILFAILIMGLFISGVASYVYAEYADPSDRAPSNNGPSFITDNSNPATKLGKFFLNFTAKPLDEDRMKDNAFIVPGLTSSIGLAATSLNILGHLGTSSNLVPFLFGNPTDSTLVQLGNNNKVRTFQVESTGVTRAPRYVVGSKTATPNVNFYLAPGYASTNLGITSRFVTLNTNDFKNNGCPEGTYLNKIVFDNSNNPTATCNYFSQ